MFLFLILQIFLLREVNKWNSDLREVLDKLSIEVNKSEEGLHVLDCLRRGPVLHHLDLIFAHPYSIFANHASEEFNFFLMLFTCVGVYR